MQARHMPGFCFAACAAIDQRCHPETISRAQKQKIGSGCNFFAIADCRVVPIRRSRLKKCSKQLQNGPFPLCGNGRESVIEKKLQKRQDFCFCDGRRLLQCGKPRENTRSRQRRQRRQRRRRRSGLKIKPRSDGANPSLTAVRFRICSGRVGGGRSWGMRAALKSKLLISKSGFLRP